MRLANLMNEYPQDVKRMQTRILSPTKFFTVVEMNDGEVFVETESTDEENITLVEVLKSKDRINFILVHRERHGSDHNEMRSYPRDNLIPINSLVRLNANTD